MVCSLEGVRTLANVCSLYHLRTLECDWKRGYKLIYLFTIYIYTYITYIVVLSLRKTPCTASCFSYIKPSSKQGVCLPVTKSFDTYAYIYIYELLSYWVSMTGLASSTLNTQQPSILSHHCNDPLEIPQGLVLQMWGGKASATRCMWPYQCGGRHFKNDEN